MLPTPAKKLAQSRWQLLRGYGESVVDNTEPKFTIPQDLRVNMMLADAAQSMGGKLFVLGGGLSVVSAKPQPISLAIYISVPWDQANIARDWTVRLVDEDGRQVGPEDKPVVVSGRFEAGRPPGLRAGTPLGVALAINFNGMPLKAGTGYSFILDIEGRTHPDWRCTLYVRSQ